ncbi:MAG: AmmeMemoRadiSam system protein B [Victivallaceae bacterium]|nr:AmmeMemoRadiSam system protein B [Victivallaceae bacterium]
MSDEKKIRPAAFAGSFYDADPAVLARQIDAAANGITVSDAGVAACVLPHAGYVFSLKAAAAALGRATAGHYRAAAVMAPSHRVGFHGIAVPDYYGFATPLGTVAVAAGLGEALIAAEPEIFVRRNDAHRQEHSCEVELPLIRRWFGELPVLPLVFGSLNAPELKRAAAALDGLGGDILWIVSSDFTHFGMDYGYVPFEDDVRNRMRELDGEAAKLICNLDFDGFIQFINSTGATICGAIPLAALIALLRRRGAAAVRGNVALHCDSGEVTGDYRSAVDYIGIYFENVGK